MIPPRVIVAATDFSDPSRTALEFAARLARQTGAALHVVHVEDPLLAEAARQSGFDLSKDTAEELGRFLAAVTPAADAAPRRHVVRGPAVDAILDVAEQQRADLVVVGSHGMSGAERLLFGSTTEGVLRHAPMSVLVTPPEWSFRPDARDLSGAGPVIAGVALSPPSVAAATAACRLAAAIGTRVEMVHVVPELPVLTRWRVHADAAMRDRVATARSALEAVMREVACTVPVQARVETGAIPNGLADAAAPSADRRPILVLGRLSGGKGAAPGSIAYRVLSLARVPVLMYVDRP
jgi:nucleotide-binding universal stress UspA family protein